MTTMLNPDPWGNGSELYSKPLDESIDAVWKVVNDAVKMFNGLVDRVNQSRVKVLLLPSMGAVHKAMGFIRSVVEKLVKLVNYAVSHHTPVVSMIVQTFNWVNNVQKPISGLVGDVPLHRDEYFGEWTGKAAKRFEEKTGVQLAAIKDVSKKAAFISAWLMAIVKDNVEFMARSLKLASRVLSELTTAAVKAGSIVGIPDALGDCSELIGSLVKEELDKLIEIGNRFIGAVSNARNLSSEMANVEAFPLGAWPQAVRG